MLFELPPTSQWTTTGKFNLQVLNNRLSLCVHSAYVGKEKERER